MLLLLPLLPLLQGSLKFRHLCRGRQLLLTLHMPLASRASDYATAQVKHTLWLPLVRLHSNWCRAHADQRR